MKYVYKVLGIVCTMNLRSFFISFSLILSLHVHRQYFIWHIGEIVENFQHRYGWYVVSRYHGQRVLLVHVNQFLLYFTCLREVDDRPAKWAIATFQLTIIENVSNLNLKRKIKIDWTMG